MVSGKRVNRRRDNDDDDADDDVSADANRAPSRARWHDNPALLIGAINALLILVFGCYLGYRTHALELTFADLHQTLQKRIDVLEKSVWAVRRTQIGTGVDMFDRLGGTLRQP